MPTIDRPTLDAVVATARANGLKTVVHVGTWEDVRHAVLAGAAAVTHTPEGQPPADIPALMVERSTFHIPTLAVQSDYSRFADDPSLLDSPLLHSIIGAKAVALFKAAARRTAGGLAENSAHIARDGRSRRTDTGGGRSDDGYGDRRR